MGDADPWVEFEVALMSIQLVSPTRRGGCLHWGDCATM